MYGASTGVSADKLKQGATLTQYYSQRKPSEYEVPVSPTCSTRSVPSPTTNDTKERRYVSAPKLPQTESEAMETEGTQALPSPLQREMIAEHYEFEGDGCGILVNPGAEQVISEYACIDESEVNSPSGYEYIDEDDPSHLINEKVSSYIHFVCGICKSILLKDVVKSLKPTQNVHSQDLTKLPVLSIVNFSDPVCCYTFRVSYPLLTAIYSCMCFLLYKTT